MKGTANVPGGGSVKSVTPEKIGAQAKLTGTEGQYVGFDEHGNATSIEFSETVTNIINEEFSETVVNIIMEEFREEINEAINETVHAATAFFGTIGTEWTEDKATGVKSQFVSVEGVLAAHDLGILDVVMTHERTAEGYAAFVEETNQFLQYITNGDAETVDGGVMFYVYGELNTIEIPFALEVG